MPYSITKMKNAKHKTNPQQILNDYICSRQSYFSTLLMFCQPQLHLMFRLIEA